MRQRKIDRERHRKYVTKPIKYLRKTCPQTQKMILNSKTETNHC